MSRVVMLLSLVSACVGASQKGSELPTTPSSAEVPPAPESSAAPSPANEHAQHLAMPSWTLEGLASGAKRLDGMGRVHRAVTTKNAEAQAFFDQGPPRQLGLSPVAIGGGPDWQLDAHADCRVPVAPRDGA